MSHGSDQSEDYWPGYVDALTSMVQVLAFVMMLLAVTVYVLSKSVSKGALEQVAKAAKVNAGPNTSVKDLTSKIVEQLEKSAAAPEKPSEKPAEKKPEQQAAAVPAAPPATAAGHEATRGDKPTEPPPDAKKLRITFTERTYRMEAAAAGQIAAFTEETGLSEGRGRVLIRAYASGASGAVTEARHLAYYRAMVARQALSSRKIAPKAIDIRLLDTPDASLGDAIEIFFLPEGAP